MTQWGLDALFNPSKRHMDEEKQRLQSTREDIGDSSGGKRIDLESGKVVINKADGSDDSAADGSTGPTGAAADPAAEPAAGTKDKPELTGARARAAARRARAHR